MKRIVVTGATSMIGIALIEECLKNDVSVLAVVRRNSLRLGRLAALSQVRIIECDLDQLDSLGSELGEFDAFYHLAWAFSSKETRDLPELQYANIKYTLDAVKLAARLKCHKFIGAGSQAEYGPVEGKIYPNTRVEPLVSYGIAKYAAGKLSRQLCDSLGMVHIWGRIFSVYGKCDDHDNIIKYALEQYNRGEVAHFTAGLQKWNFLNERDAGRILYLLGERAEVSKVYNVASSDTRPLREYILEMAAVLGDGFRYEFAQRSPIMAPGSDPDISSLLCDIAFTDDVRFADGIAELKKERDSKR